MLMLSMHYIPSLHARFVLNVEEHKAQIARLLCLVDCLFTNSCCFGGRYLCQNKVYKLLDAILTMTQPYAGNLWSAAIRTIGTSGNVWNVMLPDGT